MSFYHNCFFYCSLWYLNMSKVQYHLLHIITAITIIAIICQHLSAFQWVSNDIQCRTLLVKVFFVTTRSSAVFQQTKPHLICTLEIPFHFPDLIIQTLSSKVSSYSFNSWPRPRVECQIKIPPSPLFPNKHRSYLNNAKQIFTTDKWILLISVYRSVHLSAL